MGPEGMVIPLSRRGDKWRLWEYSTLGRSAPWVAVRIYVNEVSLGCRFRPSVDRSVDSRPEERGLALEFGVRDLAVGSAPRCVSVALLWKGG